jgi:Spy/CpxP family protein refolding chaperone
MLKRIVLCLLLSAWFLPLQFAWAVDVPVGRWWRMPRMSDELRLSEEQKNELDRLFAENRRRLIELKSAVDKEQFDLFDLFEKDLFDEAAVKQQFKKLETARARLSGERLDYLMQVRKILGFERFQKLRIAFDQIKARRLGPGNPGMKRHEPLE